MRLSKLSAAPEWEYGLIAIDDRLRWLRYCLSREHPLLVSSVEDLLPAEIQPARPEPSEPAGVATQPTSARIH